MKKTRIRKKECSVKGCRKTAISEGKCSAHATVKDMAVSEKVVSSHRIEGSAKKISRVRKANDLKDMPHKAHIDEPEHAVTVKRHVAAHSKAKKEGFNAVCFSVGTVIGRIGAYLDGK